MSFLINDLSFDTNHYETNRYPKMNLKNFSKNIKINKYLKIDIKLNQRNAY